MKYKITYHGSYYEVLFRRWFIWHVARNRNHPARFLLYSSAVRFVCEVVRGEWAKE